MISGSRVGRVSSGKEGWARLPVVHFFFMTTGDRSRGEAALAVDPDCDLGQAALSALLLQTVPLGCTWHGKQGPALVSGCLLRIKGGVRCSLGP